MQESLHVLLRELVMPPGIAGQESDAAKVARKLLEAYMPTQIDVLGNVVGRQQGRGAHILLDAHLDQIGMVVTSVEENGFLKVASVGGCDLRTLAAAEVTVRGKQPLFGVVTSTPPHLAAKEDAGMAKNWDALAVDIGFSAGRAKELVQPGDRVTLCSRYTQLQNNRVSGTALDDRAGVAVILRCLELLKQSERDANLTVLFSAQEETGGSGAKTGGFAAQAELAVAVDVSFGMAPGNPKEKCGELGKGPMIGIAPTLDHRLSQAMIDFARRDEIPYQLEVMGGTTGTNADSIQTAGRGARMALLSVPLRNMHTAAELLDLEDVENTARLLAAFVRRAAQGEGDPI